MTDIPHVTESMLGLTAEDWGLKAHSQSMQASSRSSNDAVPETAMTPSAGSASACDRLAPTD